MKTFIDTLDRQFHELHRRSCELVRNVPAEKLYFQPKKNGSLFPVDSCGELVLRSAGTIEQTFGGITARLWDDPFEWTLPESLATSASVLEYLFEVEATRARGFALFQADDDLRRELCAPEKLKTVFALLIETLDRAAHLQGRAFAVFHLLFDGKLPRI